MSPKTSLLVSRLQAPLTHCPPCPPSAGGPQPRSASAEGSWPDGEHPPPPQPPSTLHPPATQHPPPPQPPQLEEVCLVLFSQFLLTPLVTQSQRLGVPPKPAFPGLVPTLALRVSETGKRGGGEVRWGRGRGLVRKPGSGSVRSELSGRREPPPSEPGRCTW